MGRAEMPAPEVIEPKKKSQAATSVLRPTQAVLQAINSENVRIGGLTLRSGKSVGPSRDRLCVLPTGNPLWDEVVERSLLAADFGVDYVDLAAYAGARGLDMDGFEFALREKVGLLGFTLRSVGAALMQREPKAVVLPYDSTPLTRGIALAANHLGIPTACVLYPSASVLNSYDDGLVGSSACAQVGVLDERHLGNASLRPRARVLRLQLETGLGQPARVDMIRSWLGVEPTDDIVCLLGPALQLRWSDRRMRETVEGAVEAVLSDLSPRTHLVLMLRSQKNGFLTKEHLGPLAKVYKKSVLVFGEDVPVEALMHAASAVHTCDAATSWAASKLGAAQVVQHASQGEEQGASSVRGKPGEEAVKQGAEPCSSASLNEWLRGLTPRAGGACRNLNDKVELVRSVWDPSRPAWDVIAVPDPIKNNAITEGRQKYLLELMNAAHRVDAASKVPVAALAEVFVQWGAEPNESKSRPDVIRTALGRRRLYLEDGFVRSVGLWTDPNEPTLSILMDTDSVYYDATRPSLMEQILCSDWELTQTERERAKALIGRIVSSQVSKYNYAPSLQVLPTERERPRILLVDQKANDMSIKYGLASAATFSTMLKEALARLDTHDVVIKQHPCAISGGPKEAHFTSQSLGEYARHPNLHLVAFDVNPYSLIEAVDEVWVVSSGMGFEALMAGCDVTCFGAPFYSGWGLTRDRRKVKRRNKQRSLEEVFFVSYLLLTRYVDPLRGRACELETVLSYIDSCRRKAN